LTSKGDVEGGIGGFIEAVSKEGEFNSPPGHVWVKFHGLNENFLLPIAATLSVRVGVYGKGIVRNTKSGQLLCDFEACDPPEGLKSAGAGFVPTGPVPESSNSLSPTPAATKAPMLTVANPQSIMSPNFSIRTDPNDEEIEELSTSIKQTGMLQPVLVRKRQDASLERVAGSRRLRAANRASLTSIPIIVTEMSDADAFVAQLIENLQRKDLTDEEKGRAFKHALEAFPERFPNQETLAKALGKQSRSWVSEHITVPKVADELRETGVLPGEQELTVRQVRELRKVPLEERAEIIAEDAEVPSSRRIERKVKERELKRRGLEDVDTGVVWVCKVCKRKFTHIHRADGRHKLQEITET